MKILQTILYDARYPMGGAEKIVECLSKGLAARKHDVEVAVNAGDLSERLQKEGLPVTEIPFSKIATVSLINKFAQTMSRFKPDVVHSHHRYTSFWMSQCFKKKTHILHTEHVLRKDKRFFFRYGHLATAVHESVRQNLIDYYRVPEDKVITLTNALPTLTPDQKKLVLLRQRFPKTSAVLYGFCVGRLVEQKGHRYLIEALALLSSSLRQQLHIFIAGEGSLRRSLEQKANQLGLNITLEFLGHSDQVAEFLSHSDFLVLPSLWEGMPLSIIEAFGAAKPVLATDIPGTQEMVRHGANGFLVPARNSRALAAGFGLLIQNRERLPVMGRQAFQDWKEKYSFETMLEHYERIYQKINSQ